jgi:hypothetical protein
MKQEQDHLQTLSDIRSMMERSSRFISLSGLSGVIAGVFALIGAYAAHSKIVAYFEQGGRDAATFEETVRFLIIDAGLVLFLSVLTGCILTIRNSKKKGLRTWDSTARRLLINLAIPLVAGGCFCIALIYHGVIGLVAPATLIFYGLSLINASKYTFNDIRYLGGCEIVIGLVACFYPGYGLYFWALGFGVMHIIYGSVMYFKYERE